MDFRSPISVIVWMRKEPSAAIAWSFVRPTRRALDDFSRPWNALSTSWNSGSLRPATSEQQEGHDATAPPRKDPALPFRAAARALRRCTGSCRGHRHSRRAANRRHRRFAPASGDDPGRRRSHRGGRYECASSKGRSDHRSGRRHTPPRPHRSSHAPDRRRAGSLGRRTGEVDYVSSTGSAGDARYHRARACRVCDERRRDLSRRAGEEALAIAEGIQRCTKQPAVKAENQCVGGDGDDRPQDADLAEGRAELVSAGGDRGEGDVRCDLRKSVPVIAELTPALGIDRGCAADREQQQRAEQNERRKIAVYDEVYKCPEANAP